MIKKVCCRFKGLYQSGRFSFNSLEKIHKQAKKVTPEIQKADTLRLWSLEQLHQELIYSNSQNIESLLKGHTNIVVNKYFSTVANFSIQSQPQSKNTYQTLIEILNQSLSSVFLPNFYNLINRNAQNIKMKGIKLLIGDPNPYFLDLNLLKPSEYMTLEELCAIFPQKVPLSYRPRQNIENIKKNLQARLNSRESGSNIVLNQEPKFSEIILINDKIKMWDQAIQIMLDELPCKITVPFHYPQTNEGNYRLNLNDFMKGFETAHKIIHPEIKLEIEWQNKVQFLDEAFELTKKRKLTVQYMDEELKR